MFIRDIERSPSSVSQINKYLQKLKINSLELLFAIFYCNFLSGFPPVIYVFSGLF